MVSHSPLKHGVLVNGALLGNRLTVDPRTLTPLVLVRIQVPQPSTKLLILLYNLEFAGWEFRRDFRPLAACIFPFHAASASLLEFSGLWGLFLSIGLFHLVSLASFAGLDRRYGVSSPRTVRWCCQSWGRSLQMETRRAGVSPSGYRPATRSRTMSGARYVSRSSADR